VLLIAELRLLTFEEMGACQFRFTDELAAPGLASSGPTAGLEEEEEE
jgi:hypothetical protein